MRFDLLTILPDIFDSFLNESLIGKALEKGAFEAEVTDIRQFARDKHQVTDDRPFGGGPGMVMKPEPVVRAIEACLNACSAGTRRVVLLSPAGKRLTQDKVRELAGMDHLILVCGRYEGVDERVTSLVDEELSVGDYILFGGEIPAMVVVEAVARLLPGVLGKLESTQEESFSRSLIEYPQYTRPRVFRGEAVPDILLSGDHAAIRNWRLKASLKRTIERRPELLDQAGLSKEELKILNEVKTELETRADKIFLDFSLDKD